MTPDKLGLWGQAAAWTLPVLNVLEDSNPVKQGNQSQWTVARIHEINFVRMLWGCNSSSKTSLLY